MIHTEEHAELPPPDHFRLREQASQSEIND